MQHQFYNNLPLISFFSSSPISKCVFDAGSTSIFSGNKPVTIKEQARVAILHILSQVLTSIVTEKRIEFQTNSN